MTKRWKSSNIIGNNLILRAAINENSLKEMPMLFVAGFMSKAPSKIKDSNFTRNCLNKTEQKKQLWKSFRMQKLYFPSFHPSFQTGLSVIKGSKRNKEGTKKEASSDGCSDTKSRRCAQTCRKESRQRAKEEGWEGGREGGRTCLARWQTCKRPFSVRPCADIILHGEAQNIPIRQRKWI